jgi:hypothetical protein
MPASSVEQEHDSFILAMLRTQWIEKRLFSTNDHAACQIFLSWIAYGGFAAAG